VTTFKIALVSFEILEKVGTTPALPENKKGKKEYRKYMAIKKWFIRGLCTGGNIQRVGTILDIKSPLY
jgi:hypothetical protein